MTERPSSSVLTAFGGTRPLEPLAGGTGRSWRAGDVVLKPLDRAPEELAWQAATFASVRPAGFRLAPPISAADGAFVVDGWTGWRYVRGSHETGRWAEIVEVSERLHRTLAAVARPGAIVDPRTNQWDVGDLVAWEEQSIEPFLHVRHLRRLAGVRRPLAAPSQLIHGDLTGNVLFADGLPPAVIDFSPYWRPADYASAIVVGDALLWEGADESLASAVAHVEHFAQYLVRALIYRLVTHAVFVPESPDFPDETVASAVDLAARLDAADRDRKRLRRRPRAP